MNEDEYVENQRRTVKKADITQIIYDKNIQRFEQKR